MHDSARLIPPARIARGWVSACVFAAIVLHSSTLRAATPNIPLPALNWEFLGSTAEEVSRGDVWTLQDRDAGSPISYGGWFSGGLTINNWGNTTMLGNSQLPFNNDPHLNLNQGWLWFEKAADTEGAGWDWGFHVDLMAGCDGPDTEAFGGPGWDSTW